MASNSTISITFKLNDDTKSFKDLVNSSEGLKKALEGAVVEAERLPKSLGRSNFSGLQKQLMTFTAGLVSMKAMLGVVKNAANTMIDFEKANSELAAVLGKTRDQVTALTEAAKELGRTTTYTASDVTALQTSLARLGFTEPQILAMQESVLKFAAATGTDLASAADFTGAALRAFGLQATDTNELLDMMAKSTSASALSFSKLNEMMSTVAPVANAFGIKARDTVAMLGVMSNAGFDASSAATALRNILLKLADSNGDLAKRLGVTARTMPEIINGLKKLNDAGVDLTETLALTDKRSVAAFNALLSGATDVEELYNQLGNANGALDDMYDTMTNNVAGAIAALQSAWEGFVLAFQNSDGTIMNLLNRFATGINHITTLISGGNSHDFRANQAADMIIASGQFKRYSDYENAIAEGERKIAETSQWNVVQMERLRRALDALKIARDKVFGTNTDATGAALTLGGAAGPASTAGGAGAGTGGSKTKGKTLADAINDYKKSVESAVAVNRTFGATQSENEVRLEAMKSGITSLIRQYGAEDERIKALIHDYRLLLGERGNIEKLAPIAGLATTSQGGLAGSRPGSPAYVNTMMETQSALMSVAEAFGDVSGALNDNASQWLGWVSNVLASVSKALPAITALTAGEAASSMASIPFAGPVAAVAAITSVLAAFASLPKFAAGGIAYGPTVGMFGEYAGAAHNPEVVAPLDKLRSLIGEGPGMSGHVEFEIDGRKLRGVLRNVDKLDHRNG